MIAHALKTLNLNKSTSWDFIPGKALEIFKQKSNLPHLVKFINSLIQSDIIPPELGRLMYLNKNASEPGNLTSIRPIVIMGVITKLCEQPLLKHLRDIKLHKGQIGFRRNLGCEINLMRFRQLIHELKQLDYVRKKKMKERFVQFVDLKMAFDSVKYRSL